MAAWPNLGTRKRGDQPLAQQRLEHPDDLGSLLLLLLSSCPSTGL